MFAIIAVTGMAALLLMLTMIARFEKRMVWPYGSLEATRQFGHPFDYGNRWVDGALKAGCSLLGWAPDLRAPRFRVSYGLLVSRERDCLVIVGVGEVLSMPVQGTWIYTQATDGRMFCTVDNQSCVEIDVSRHWRGQLARVDAFPDLLQRHRDWVRDCGAPVRPFSLGREAEEFRRARQEHYQAMSRQGLIDFPDVSATQWHYTFVGGLKYAVLNYSIGMLRAVTSGRVPRSA